MKNLCIVVLVVFLSGITPVYGQVITDHWAKELEHLLAQEKVPALGLGIIKDGKLRQTCVFGHLKKGVPAPDNTIFKVASLTKPVVALITLRLVSLGRLELDEQLSKYWIDPDLNNDRRVHKLTPRLILSHQSGFPNWRWQTESQKLTFEFNPGTDYRYSGEGFEYLRRALERKFDAGLAALADSLLFKPAGMKDTHLYWDRAMDPARYAENHDENGTMLATDKYDEVNAAASLLTTVEDYGNFLVYVLHGAGLTDEVFDEMVTPQVKISEDHYFGLGWLMQTNFSTGDYSLFHTGKDPGVNALAAAFPKSGRGFFVFMNGDNAEKIYEKLLTEKLYLGKEIWSRKE